MPYTSNRRQFIQLATVLMASSFYPISTRANNVIVRPIPSSGELLPVIGMGSSQTFDVKLTEQLREQLTETLEIFFNMGGSLIDSSPMYGSAESVVGELLSRLNGDNKFFAATKVWTKGKEQGIEQMRQSIKRMRVPKFDLIQIHNLSDWKTQLQTLKQWKRDGKVRYIGITTSHKQKHAEVAAVMRNEAIDFVQFSYNINNRLAEEKLLPLAQERSIATVINRPYQMAQLFEKSKGKPLPELATEIDCQSWAQFYLKFILAHPAVTCIIPATSKPKHMRDNMGAGLGAVPNEEQRQQMLKVFHSL